MKLACIIVLVVSLAGVVNAQRCYQCNGFSTNLPRDQDINIPGYTRGCSSQIIVDCSAEGGCFNYEYILDYTSTSRGEFSIKYEVRACGLGEGNNYCLAGSQLSSNVDGTGASIADLVATVDWDAGLSYTGGEGKVCLCSGDLCNDASLAFNSGARVRAPILCSLILALVSIVFARLA